MKKGENTRQFIIEKAALLLNHKGIAGTAISDIMEATSLAKGGIYRNFESKDEICLEAYGYLSKRLSSAIFNVINEQVTAKDKLFAMLDFYSERLAMNDIGGCPMLNFGTDADDTNPEMALRVAESIKSSQSRISGVVKQGIEAGDFKSDINAEHFAIKMFTMLEGAILTSRVFKNPEQMRIVANLLKTEIESFTD